MKCTNTTTSIWLHLDAKFCTTPLTTFGIVSDFVTRAKTNPLGDGSVLSHFFAQGLFGAEGFVGRHAA